MWMKVLATAVAAVALAGCGTQVESRGGVIPADPLIGEHFRRTASFKDDALDTVAVISTQPGYTDRRGSLGIAREDNFLRAAITKKTGSTVIVVYQSISYEAPSWRFYRRANYQTTADPVAVDLRKVSSDVKCSSSRNSQCRYEEDFIFYIPEDTLRRLVQATPQAERHRTRWAFKFGSQRGEDLQQSMAIAEVEGLLLALDDYRAKLQGTTPK